MAGYSTKKQQNGMSILLGLAKMIGTMFAMWKVDHIGRRPLLLWGQFGMLLSISTLAVAFYLHESTMSLSADQIGLLAVISLMLFVGCYSFGYGPVTWIIIAEIYPQKYRGRAMAMATVCLL